MKHFQPWPNFTDDWTWSVVENADCSDDSKIEKTFWLGIMSQPHRPLVLIKDVDGPLTVSRIDPRVETEVSSPS